MAIHTIIEINHDKAHLWEENDFGKTLLLAITDRHPQAKRLLAFYGIRILNQHHSSHEKEIIVHHPHAKAKGESS
jgi:hypothetical protein